jgi:hypothetical protein
MDNSHPGRGRFPNWLTVALFIFCAALLLTSCSKKASTAIIGKWRAQDTKETVEFRKDGTVVTARDTTADPPGDTQTLTHETTGKYNFTDANHMDVQINTGDTNQPSVSISCEVRINGDKMTIAMTNPGNRQQHRTSFKRLE